MLSIIRFRAKVANPFVQGARLSIRQGDEGCKINKLIQMKNKDKNELVATVLWINDDNYAMLAPTS